MVAYVDTLRLLAQPELTENRMARKSDTKEIKNKHSSRPVGEAETGGRGLRGAPGRRGLTWPWQDRDWRSVGRTGQAVQPLADPVAPHSHTDKPRRPDSRVVENGAGRAAGITLRPHIHSQINRTNGGERSRPSNPGLQRGEIKPQTSE